MWYIGNTLFRSDILPVRVTCVLFDKSGVFPATWVLLYCVLEDFQYSHNCYFQESYFVRTQKSENVRVDGVSYNIVSDLSKTNVYLLGF